jgi:restriction system protein
VDEIRHGLAEQGLSTTPPFTDGAIDSIITVIAIGPGPDAPGRRLPDRSRTEAIEDVDSADEPLTLRISNMPSANLASRDARLVTVHLNDPLERAATLMTARNFSQLPVVGTESGNPSAISWRSIGQARLSMSNPMLRDALDENIRIVQLHDPLLGWVDAIYRDGYVLVTESIGTLTGIVTAADLTERFHQEQRPYVLLEEMERRLRRSLVRAGFTSSQLHQYARGVKPENLASKKEQLSVEKLTIKEYCTLLADFEAWKILMWQVDQKTLLEYLEKVRDIRNSLMHFRDGLDPVGPEQLDIIGGAVSIIKAADPRP